MSTMPPPPEVSKVITRRVWCDILPPAPCYAAGQVHTMYAPSLPQVYGSGMPKPTMAGGANGTRLSRPPSKALLELTLTLEGGLLGSYCSQPQFDSLLEHPGSTRHERPPLAPERLLLASHRVNAISSGPIRTIAASGIPGFDRILDHVEANAPLRRNVSQDDVAGATLWLASPLAAGVTGQCIYVDAGYSITMVPETIME